MIEDALRAQLLTLTAVTALTTTIRTDTLAQQDALAGPAVLIAVDEETPENTLDGLGGLVEAKITISAVSSQRSQARALAEAIRTNGTTPGTGLAGFTGTTAGMFIDAAILERRQSGYIPEEDGSDSGLYSVDSHYLIQYTETT